MPSWRRPPGAPDSHAEDASGREEAPRSVAEAEEEVAWAEARADEARARLARLRRQAWALESPGADDTGEIYAGDAGEFDPLSEMPYRRQLPKFQRPGPRAVALAAAFGIIGASLGGSVFMELEHRALARERHRAAEFAAAAREGVTKLMSIDANHAREDIQRALDDSTGDLRDQLLRTGVALAQQVEESQISTRVIVDATAVESTTDDSGIVLVAARSDNLYPDDAKRPMNSWRISVHLSREGGQLRMAKVEFLQ
ncbi:hypothetical protein MSIMFB_04644 [Mycobacterium simulans]|uniref:Uncharacterized protein n=1 Tax=Mycobacterium simulans TaxID=627089 RepID=A0A7Z7IR20_9MYCO|nr:hypothetical protein [Mycobacterium simulans]SOJ57166.1 hypothetical protein MSIMFB_04644 [Mycobacterium simulans]